MEYLEDYQIVIERLREIDREASRWDKSGGYEAIYAIAKWIKFLPKDEREIVYEVLIEELRTLGEFAWSVPLLVSVLEDATFAQKITVALPELRRLATEEPTLYNELMVFLRGSGFGESHSI